MRSGVSINISLRLEVIERDIVKNWQMTRCKGAFKRTSSFTPQFFTTNQSRLHKPRNYPKYLLLEDLSKKNQIISSLTIIEQVLL